MSIRHLVIAAAICLLLMTGIFQAPSANVWSRTATAASLVERGTMSIDQDATTWKNVDKVFVGGKFYSDKPPTMAFVMAALYYPLYHLGFHISQGRNVAYILITFLVIGCSTLLCLVLFYQVLRYSGLDERKRLLMTAGLAFCTLFFTWSSTINNHTFGGAWTFIALALLITAEQESANKTTIRVLLAGAAVGLAAAGDTACTLFVCVFGVLALASGKLRRSVWAYALAAGLVLLPGIWASHLITGDFRPITVHQQYFHYPGSYWDAGFEHLSGVGRQSIPNAVRYAAVCLFGPNGFLLYDPLLILALAGLGTVLARRKPMWREGLSVAVGCAGFAAYFILYTDNYSGNSYSMRWFVTLIPMLWLFAYPFFERWTKGRKMVFGALCAFSFVIALVGGMDQWPQTRVYPKTPAFSLNWKMEVMPRIKRALGRPDWNPYTGRPQNQK